MFTSDWRDNSAPELFNAESVILLLVLIFLAYLVSPYSSLGKAERDRLVLVYPLLVFVYVFLFQVSLLSVNPFIHYYLGSKSFFTWRTNTGLCCAFGAAFSFSVLRNNNFIWRIYGGISMLLFSLLAFGYKMPMVMNVHL